ncbi:MAG: response regulator [Polyangiaceae bacterium]|nr:response regulator [Polyangiaceae bacterium]
MANDPYKYFRIEARDILDELGKGVLDLEKGPPAPALVQRLLRYGHTLKGAARVVKQKEIADLAHAVEDALTPFREGEAPARRDQLDGLLKLLDAIGVRVAALGAPVPASAPASEQQQPPPEAPFRTLRADVEEMDMLIDGVAEAHVQLLGLRRGLTTLDRIRQLQGLLVDQLRSPRTQRAANGAGATALAIAEELGEHLAAMTSAVTPGVEQVDRELRQVREAAERLRLLPVALMFNVLERSARDAAQSVGKRVVFEATGGDVRLDAPVLGVIQNALVQVVRNAVAHGVETTAERAAAGKPAEGKVLLSIARRGNRVSFSCSDDGRGVDVEAVRRAAQQKGAHPGELPGLGPQELIGLLLKGGISTSRRVTEVSGRGVGLDVVREAASRLGGELDVRTEKGKGTRVEIVVPVSLASLDALLVEAGGQTAAIPLEAVRQTLRVASSDVARTADGEAIVFRGAAVPFAPLSRSLVGSDELVAGRKAWSAVIIESAGSLAAIGVDGLLGTETVVVRPLPRLCIADPVVGGASLDAGGNPRIVLDAEALVADVRRAQPAQPVSSPRPKILVIDDSLTTRMLEQSILESAGYEVDLAVSAEEGLQKARRERYGLFLVDVEMPGMDGFEFVERTRADPTLTHVPAFLVTSRCAPEDKQRGEDVGAQGYIVKSEFDQTDLLGRIRTLVG